MSRRAFWPGFRWRILAHRREPRHKPYVSESMDIRSGWEPHPVYERADGIRLVEGDWEFDELVIDDWLHVEQMSGRHWWIGVGNGDDYWHVNVHIDRDGRASVSMEKQ